MGVVRQKLTEREEERGLLERKVTELSATVSSTFASYAFLEQALAAETTKYDPHSNANPLIACAQEYKSKHILKCYSLIFIKGGFKEAKNTHLNAARSLKMLLFQVAAVMEGHPASQGQSKWVSGDIDFIFSFRDQGS